MRSPAWPGSPPRSWKQASSWSLASGTPTSSSHTASSAQDPQHPGCPQATSIAGLVGGREAGWDNGTHGCLVGEVHSMCEKDQSATNLPSRPGKAAPSTAEPAEGWVCLASFSLVIPCLSPPAGQGQRRAQGRSCQGRAAETILAGLRHPLGMGRGQAPRPWGPSLRMITLVVVCGSCWDTKPWGSNHCQEETSRGVDRVSPRLPSWHVETCPGAGKQPVADSSDGSRTRQWHNQTLPCDGGNLLAAPSAG